jgi:hypothetical protein
VSISARKPRSSQAHPSADRGHQASIPTGAPGRAYADDLAQYLDQLLDEALQETFPASDAVAVPSRQEIEKEHEKK